MALNREEVSTDVLIAGTGSLLHQAIANLILQEPGIHVATVTGADPSVLLKDTDGACPDVILWCETDPLNQAQLFEVLSQIRIHEPLRLIVVRREENVLEVYDKKYIELNRNANVSLITLIKDR